MDNARVERSGADNRASLPRNPLPATETGAMTPFLFGILLHYYSRCGDPDQVRENVPAWSDHGRDFLLRHELIQLRIATDIDHSPRYDATYEVTARGRVFINAALATPLPILKWVVFHSLSCTHSTNQQE